MYFHNNTKWGSGGAIEIEAFGAGGSTTAEAANFVSIKACTFRENRSLRSGPISSQGGAISISGPATNYDCHVLSLFIEKSFFLNNLAIDGGGSLFLTDSCLVTTISESSFQVTDHDYDSSKGTFVLSYSEITIDRSAFTRRLQDHSALSPSLLELQMLSDQAEIVELGVILQCPTWYWPSVDNHFLATQAKEVTLACMSCPISHYVLSDGNFLVSFSASDTKVHVLATTFATNDSGCKPCPAGANCLGNDFAAKPNFWGHVTKGNEIDMHQCPADYCCTKNCTGYDQCSGHRTGVLCGSCQENYSLSILSSDCVKTKECKDYWVWPLISFAIFMYVMWYTFKNDAFGIPAKVAKMICRSLFTTAGDGDGDVNYVDKGYFGIVTYFIQVKAVMELSTSLDHVRSVDKIFSQIELYCKVALNFELRYLSNNACVVRGLTASHKLMFRVLFLFGIFTFWNILFAVTLLSKQVMTVRKYDTTKLNSFQVKLVYGLVEIIKYTYLSFSSVVFYSLTCTFVAENHIWLHDGSVECYSVWQIAMITFCLVYTIPYPFLVFLGMKLLNKKMITKKSFFIATIFPLPVALYWLVLNFREADVVAQEIDIDEHEVLIARAFYDGFKSGFRESTGGTQYWEAVVMFRRLAISATIMIPDTLIQLSVCLALCLVFQSHHLYIKPFRHSISNLAEGFSLSLLCGVAAINLVKASFIHVEKNPQGSQEHVLENLQLLEIIFVVVLVLLIVSFETVFAVAKWKKSKTKKTCVIQQSHSTLPVVGPAGPSTSGHEEEVQLETVVHENPPEGTENDPDKVSQIDVGEGSQMETQ